MRIGEPPPRARRAAHRSCRAAPTVARPRPSAAGGARRSSWWKCPRDPSSLDVGERERLDGQRAERMAQVVEDDRVILGAQPAKPGGLERDVEALAHGVVMERNVVA